jgi:Flp pilus assembly protein CpaB
MPLILVVMSSASVMRQARASGSEVGTERPEANFVRVLVAKQDLPAATFLTKPSECFEAKNLAFGKAPARSYHRFDEIKDQMLVNPISKGECVTQHHLIEPGKARFPANLSPGQIPFTVRIEPDCLGGPARPSFRMHLVFTAYEPKATSTVLLEKVLVLAADTDESATDPKAKLQTLLVVAVYPDQAKQLRNASSRGELRAIYPRFEDDMFKPRRAVKLKDLLERLKNDP